MACDPTRTIDLHNGLRLCDRSPAIMINSAAVRYEERRMTSQTTPNNYPQVTPYLAIDGAAAAIEFYKKAFGATERMRFDAPGGRIGHAEIEIEGGLIMLADAHAEIDFRSPVAL